MKTVIYKGPPANIGRFGRVEAGAHLQLIESEYEGVKDDPQFELVSRRKPARDIFPLGTPLFDLRLVEWDHSHLSTHLSGKGQTTLKLIANAMNSVGADVIITEHDGTDLIVDAIAAEAKALKWDNLGREERLALPLADEANTDEDTDEDTEGGPDFTKLSVKQLREVCDERGLDSTGSKAELLARLEEQAGG